MYGKTRTMTTATIKACLTKSFAALLPILCSIPLFCALCAAVFAQTSDTDAPQWYQVEVVIFERANEQYTNENSEEWPKNIIFGYPKDTIHLLSNDELLAKLEQEKLANNTHSNSIDNNNLDNSSLDNSSLDNNLDTYNNTDDQTNDSNINALTRAEQPFILLDKSERQLNIDTQRINRKNNLRVLFHEAWRQPLEAQQAPSNVLILGGNEYDGHHELEGTLNLRVNRYLHVSTNLWFNRFAANYGQESLHWPPLPDIPQDLPSENDDVTISSVDESFSQDYGISPNLERRNTFSDNTNSTDINYAFSVDRNQNTAQWGLTSETNPYWQSTGNLTKSEPSAYLVEEIILMQQNRRMRSEELHYIDHPRLGITIKITPYELADETQTIKDL